MVSAVAALPEVLVAQIHLDPAQRTRPRELVVVFHQSYFRGFESEVPYNVAEVELEEGPRLLTNLVDISNDQIRAQMPVEIVFDDVTDDITLAKFKPRDG